ncbi:MAG: tRNA lysidine(34) synthetase TilS [Bacteroidales bacterium]|nr:tRNA lysidine(34) synthetase TilS [Bacteroidales bacterium]
MQKRFDRILEMMKREAGVRPPSLLNGSGPEKAYSASSAVCEPSPSVLLAVSGGIDSMCLAELFLNSSAGLEFEIAHCNFHLRGDESDSDAALVREWGKRNGVKVHVADFETLQYAELSGQSIEMAARELRYRWFGKLCREEGFSAVAMAHHADDNAETLFLNLVRGTGLKGICGMSMFSSLPCQEPEPGYGREGRRPFLFRPLLEFTREQIEGYAMRHRIEYHTDRTNADTTYRRNLIRNEVFPLLERLNPSFIKTVNREMRYFSQAYRIVEEEIAGSRIWGESMYACESGADDVCCPGQKEAKGKEDRSICIAELMEEPHWEYILYRILEQYGFNSSVIESVEKLLESASGQGGTTLAGKKFCSGSHVLVTSSSELVIKSLLTRNASGANQDMEIHGPGEYMIGDTSFSIGILPREDLASLKAPKGVLYFDAEALSFPFICRKWKKGDWIRPFGMRGKKKVSDLFTDLKYDLFKKDEALMLAAPGNSDGHVLAILGERIDDSLKITDRTSAVVAVSKNL